MRVHAHLRAAHVDFLCAAAGAHFGGRVNATARALLARAMEDETARRLVEAGGGGGAEGLEEEEEEEEEGGEGGLVMFTMQIGEAQSVWVAAVAGLVAREEEGMEGMEGKAEDEVLRRVFDAYLAMGEKEREMVLAELGEDEEAMAAVVMSGSHGRRRSEERCTLLVG